MTQISFQIKNGDTRNTIYLPTDDPSVNQIVLQISSDTGLTLTATKPMPESEAGTGGGTLFYLHLSQLGLLAAELDALDVQAPGWTAAAYHDDQTICLAPDVDGPLAAGTTLEVTVANFTAAKGVSGGSAQLYMKFFNAAPVSSGLLPFTYNSLVTLQAPPSGNLDLHTVLRAQLLANTVVQSRSGSPEVANAIELALTCGDDPKQVEAGPDTVFTVSLVYADDIYGYGALTTVERAEKITVAPGSDTSGWLITPPPKGAANPSWMLQPPEGQPILGTADAVEFSFGNIVTTFQPGVTVMMVSYSGVPGYDDGAFCLLLDKERHVFILSCIASPNPAVLDNEEASVTLSWNAPADRLTLMPGYIDVTGKDSHTTTIRAATQFTLVAQGKSVLNYATRSVQVDIFPEINAMVATPKFLHQNDFQNTVLLDWNVGTDGDVLLRSSVDSTKRILPKKHTINLPVAKPQMFTVTPKDNATGLLIERNQVLSAFTISRTAVTLNSAPIAVAASLTDDIYAVIQAGRDSVVIFDTVTNTAYPTTVTAGSGPVAVAFSPDGSRLFVANGGSASLSVFRVGTDAAGRGYAFDKLADVSLSGTPVKLRVSADGTSIFVLSKTTTKNPGVLDIVTTSDGTGYALRGSVDFPVAVTDLDVLPSASQVFVLSAADKSITVVGYDSIHKRYCQVRRIGGFTAAETPTALAVAAQDAGTLLVACNGSNAVYAMDIQASSVENQQKLDVGANPACIAVVDTRSYAYVGNADGKSLTLLSCYAGYGACKVVASSCDNKAAPTAIACTVEGSPVYVADTAGLSIWNNVTYQPQGAQPSASQVTSVAASRTQVASWHNDNIPFGGDVPAPTPGLWIYDRLSEVSCRVNDDVRYTTFLFWPEESLKMAIATQAGDNRLFILETVGFSTATNVPFADSPTSRAIATAISRFGNMVFVLAQDNQDINLVALTRDAGTGTFSLVDTVSLFTGKGSSAHALATVSDGSRVYVTDGATHKLYTVAKTDSGYALGTTYDLPAIPQAMICAPDDRTLFVFMSGNNLRGFARFDIAAGRLESFLLPAAADFQIHGIAISPDGSRIFASDSNAGGIRIFSTRSMQNVETVAADAVGLPMGIAVAPDGSGLFLANAFSGKVSIVDQLPAKRAALQAPAGGSALTSSSYSGIFVRDYDQETPTSNTGSGWTDSPDIIPWGTAVFPNPADLGDPNNYHNKEYSQNIQLDQINNVYVRGMNYATGPQKSRVYFYWVTQDILLYPSQWSPFNFTVDRSPQNWLDITASAQGAIAYSPAPINWKPSSHAPHYCLIVWVDNSDNPSPPDLGTYANFKTWNDLGQFILDHPNVAWRNTTDVTEKTAFMNAQTVITGPSGGGSVEVGVRLNSVVVAEGGTIKFTLLSSDGKIHYESPNHTIDTNTFSETIDWPANAVAPLLTYTYAPPNKDLKGGENITGFATWFPSVAMLKTIMLRAPHLLLRVPKGKLKGVTGLLLGTTRFRYKP